MRSSRNNTFPTSIHQLARQELADISRKSSDRQRAHSNKEWAKAAKATGLDKLDKKIQQERKKAHDIHVKACIQVDEFHATVKERLRQYLEEILRASGSKEVRTLLDEVRAYRKEVGL